jgi:histidinol-phosphate aminotransferase
MSYFRPHIATMSGYVPGEQPQSGKFIKLNTNENPYPCSPRVALAIHAALDRGLGRYPDALASAFRVRAGDILGIDPEWILCGNGSDEILTIVTRALVGPGELMRMPYPSYILYRTLARIQDARCQEVHFREDWSLTSQFHAPADDLKLVLLPNPNSPSGTVIPPRAIAELADALPCPLLVDEAYADFAAVNCLDLVRENEKILVSRSLSKSYALAGLRFGFLVAQPQMIQQLVKLKDSYNCDSLAIAGATAAIDDQPWRHENRARILATRRRLQDALRRLGFQGPESQANFVWCRHPRRSSESLYRQLKDHQILVRYMDYPGWDDGLRISIGTDEQTDACLSLLQSMV